MNTIFTIGHSNHAWEDFLNLLQTHGVSALADVRSQPFSRRFPQFSKANLQASLAAADIAYVFLGRELGARCEDRSCYANGQVDFERVARTEAFQRGLNRVREGAERFAIAMMCAEKEPLDCHRTILVARHLHASGSEVVHILGDGSTEPHADAQRRLLAQLGIDELDMFRDRDEAVADAYRQRGRQIAFQPESEEE
jgi:uncharacterized protein (DUF488 family)